MSERERATEQADEIEVTPAMVEAGVKVLWLSGAIENAAYAADCEVVKDVFITMNRVRLSHNPV